MEEWKKIDGYDNYSVSSEGRVKNDKTGRILKGSNKSRYLSVLLCKNGKTKRFYVHRLVSIAFIPNPNNLPCIDHINTKKDDNRVENLRWCSQKDNCNNPLTLEKRKGKNNTMYGRTGEKHPKSKKVICVMTGKIYGSTREASRQTGVNQVSISACCCGKQRSVKDPITGEKLIFMFLEDYESLK